MFVLRRAISAAAVLACFLGRASAAPQPSVHVAFAPWRIGVPAGTAACDSGLRLGDQLWLGAHRLKDQEIVRVLYLYSRLGMAPQIWLDYDAGPDDVRFGEVVRGVGRLSRLVEANLWKDRAVEIVVFPFHNSATMTTLRYDDGQEVNGIVERGDKLSGLTWQVGQIIVGPRSGTSVDPPCTTRVTIAHSPNSRHPADTGLYRCELSMFDELWRSDHRLHRVKDKDIACAIARDTQFYCAFQIQLEIGSADEWSFALVTGWIEKLKRLIDDNAREGCPVEIVVFPTYPPGDAEDGA
jgi:hypothetical protein